jgi:hypothetical protein
MPYLNTLSGLLLVTRYVKNWYSLLALYSHIIPESTIKFKDGMSIVISKRSREVEGKLNEAFGLPRETLTWLQNSNNFDVFYEELYRRHLKDNGFTYDTTEPTVVRTPGGLEIAILPPYSFVLDEIFLMKIYGEPDLNGRSVIDVGASIGDSSLYFATLGASKIYGFETDENRYNIARKNIKSNNMIQKIEIYNEDATAEVLKSLIFKKELKDVFIKLDCEGCEYSLFQNTDPSVFDRIKDVVMEYHRKPEPLIKTLIESQFEVKKQKTKIFASKKRR